VSACARSVIVVAIACIAPGCDVRRALHPPDPDFNRMLVQPKGQPYEATRAFENGAVMRAPPSGAIPFGGRQETRPPLSVALLTQGRERYEILCAACHGVTGEGTSVVATKMQHRPPPSFLEARLTAYSAEEIHRVVVEGFGLMRSYATDLDPSEMWAVAEYVKALQFSRHAQVASLPPDVRRRLEAVAP
jgi:cytochrome c553